MKYDVNAEIYIVGVIVGDGYLDVVTNKCKMRFLDTKEVFLSDIKRLWEESHKEKNNDKNNR